MSYKNAIVIGAGAFGTSIASVLSKNFEKVFLKVRSADVYQSIKESGENKVYLTGQKLPRNLTPCLEWEELEDEVTLQEIDLIVSGLPTYAIKPYFEEHKEFFVKYFKQDIPLVNLAKGIDPDTLELPSDLFYDVFPDYKNNFLFLSGPSFAQEILDEQVTLVSVAGK